MAKKSKKDIVPVPDDIKNETHMEVFRRLSNPKFNSGAMHGTPGERKKKG